VIHAGDAQAVHGAAVSHTFWHFAHGGANRVRATVEPPVSPRRFAPALLCLAFLAACGGNGTGSSSGAPSITVFEAASLARVMADLRHAFAAGGHTAPLLDDAEGTQLLLTKLEADPAAADVFISADRRHMDDAVSRGLVQPPRDLAFNRVVVIVPAANPAHISSFTDLARPGVRISLADASVPAGSYAEQALQLAESNRDAPAGFARAVLANVVTRQIQVTTVVTDVSVGVVDAGIVYATDARNNSKVTALPIPQRDQPVTVYVVAVTKHARNPSGAREFVDFLLSPPGQSVLLGAGFASPAPTAQPPGPPRGSMSPGQLPSPPP
jgi:molybdate transport system substrate-binding protein